MNQKNVKPRSASCLKQIRKIEMNLYSTYRHHIHFSFFPVCFSSGEAIIMCVCPQGADEPISCQRGTLPLLHGTSSWVDLPALFVPWSCPHFWNVQLSFHSPRKKIWICLNKSLNPTKNSKAKKVLVLVFFSFLAGKLMKRPVNFLAHCNQGLTALMTYQSIFRIPEGSQ